MKRDMMKYAEQFKKRFEEKNKGAIYIEEPLQLIRASENSYDLACNSIAAGFIMGYAHAKREMRKKKANGKDGKL